MIGWTVRAGLHATLFGLVQSAVAHGQSTPPRTGTVIVDYIPGHALHTFRPEQVLGAALDGHARGEIAAIYTPANRAAMNSAGLGPVTYRLRTELAIEAWHWNPRGRWSDPVHHQGYWISNDSSAEPIEVSYGYRLPRRGRTLDDGNNDGYSRVDDGDTATFWKTNPYLDPRYTGDRESVHPQWLVVDLGASGPVNAARLDWGEPYPRRYLLDFWEGDQSVPIDRSPVGRWRRFPNGEVVDGHGGDAELPLADHPVNTRFVRVTLFESSHTAAGGNGDPRDSLGFALREIRLGTLDSAGHLYDLVRHGRAADRQSQILVSSTDPWHRKNDLDPNVEQPGFDRVFKSGLSHGLPVLIPVPILFDIPENAAAELRFLRLRNYPVERIEMGEEPDGQRVTPEDYGALYLQFGRALHAVDPWVTLGGPAWQTALNASLTLWPDRPTHDGRPTWLGRFLDYLEPRSQGRELGFFSFEWYPFDDPCNATDARLGRAPALLTEALAGLRAAGLSDSVPWIMTEYGYSAYAGPPEVELPGALFNTDVVGTFLSLGGAEAYLYGYEPGSLLREPGCRQWGNNMLFLADEDGQVRYRMPTYYAARLVMRVWADSMGGVHELYPARLEPGGPGADLVSVFALRRPDTQWSLLFVNRDPTHVWSISPEIRTGLSPNGRPLSGPAELWQYGMPQYRWRSDGARGRPTRDEPPTHRTLSIPPRRLSLAPYSITVLVGRSP